MREREQQRVVTVEHVRDAQADADWAWAVDFLLRVADGRTERKVIPGSDQHDDQEQPKP